MGTPAEWNDFPRKELKLLVGFGDPEKILYVREAGPNDYYLTDKDGAACTTEIHGRDLPEGPVKAIFDKVDIYVPFARIRVEGPDVVAYRPTDPDLRCKIGELHSKS